MSTPKNILIVGATRGLGASLAKQYAAANHTVFGTARSKVTEYVLATVLTSTLDPSIKWITDIDIGTEHAGAAIVSSLNAANIHHIDIVHITAGFFHLESFDSPSFNDQLTMYRTSAIGPVFLVRALHKAQLLPRGSKIFLISSESGSITLRHATEGGGAYGHHGSKAAENMVGKLLALDLKEDGVVVGLLHPGFMRTEMTKGVGFDKFWDDGGAVTPDEAAKSIVEFVEGFGIERTGTFWAPRGPGDIGTAEAVLGKKDTLPTPLELPW